MKIIRGMFWALMVAVALTTLTLAAGAQTPMFQLIPTPNQWQINNSLFASSASSPNDIWAVGYTTIHFDGKQWRAFPAPGYNDACCNFLRSVLTFSPTLALAGGGRDDQGQIIDRWNGEKWQRVQGLPFPPAWVPFVMTMSGTSPNDIWVSGSVNPNGNNPQIFLEHWNGQSWSTNNYFPGVAFFYGSSQDAVNDAWVVGLQSVEGEYYAPAVLHYDGTNWNNVSEELPFSNENGVLEAVQALAPNNVWAVGWQNSGDADFYTNYTLVYHYDGNSWRIVPSPDTPGTNLFGMAANSPEDIYAFGNYADPDGYSFDTLLLRWDGSKWNFVRSPDPKNGSYFFNQLSAGVVPSPGNVWIFGQQFVPHGVCTVTCTLAIHTTSGP